MNRLSILAAVVVAIGVVAGCEPQNVAVAPPSSPPVTEPSGVVASASTDTGGGSALPSLTLGEAVISGSGANVAISGLGPVLKTPLFSLAGPVTMTLSTCGSNGTFPFVWLYSEFNAQIGQYVEQVTSIKTAAGKYYLHVVTPPDCSWTIKFAG
jgi:hypothetical protein